MGVSPDAAADTNAARSSICHNLTPVRWAMLGSKYKGPCIGCFSFPPCVCLCLCCVLLFGTSLFENPSPTVPLAAPDEDQTLRSFLFCCCRVLCECVLLCVAFSFSTSYFLDPTCERATCDETTRRPVGLGQSSPVRSIEHKTSAITSQHCLPTSSPISTLDPHRSAGTLNRPLRFHY